MSGFLGGDRDTHYAYGAARSIHAGEWDRWLELLASAISDRVKVIDGGEPAREPSPFSFLPGSPDSR